MTGARLSTIPALSSAVAAKASSARSAAGSCLAAINDHQGDDAARGLARGAMRRLPHGHVPYQFQFAGADAPWQRPVRFSSSRRTGHNFPAMRLTAAGRAFLSVRLRGSSPFAAQSVSDEPLQQIALSEVLNHPKRLSSTDLDGIDPNENGLTHAQKFFAPGAKAND